MEDPRELERRWAEVISKLETQDGARIRVIVRRGSLINLEPHYGGALGDMILTIESGDREWLKKDDPAS
jgi:hypothetical protein